MDRIERIARRIVADDHGLMAIRTPLNAARYVMNKIYPYTTSVYRNDDKSYSALNEAKAALFGLGLDVYSKNEHQPAGNGGWRDLYAVEFVNNDGRRIRFMCQFTVFLAGTVSDNELSYDFTFETWVEESQKDGLSVVPEDPYLKTVDSQRKAVSHLENLVDKYTHSVYMNIDHKFEMLKKAMDNIDATGMEPVGSGDYEAEESSVGKVVYLKEYQFENESGRRFNVECRFTVFLAGTVDDRMASYDFIFDCK